LSQTIKELEAEMLTAANNLEFEKAALLRDQIRELKRAMEGGHEGKGKPVNYGRGQRGRARGNRPGGNPNSEVRRPKEIRNVKSEP